MASALFLSEDLFLKNPGLKAVQQPLKRAMLVIAAVTFATIALGALAPIESAAVATGQVTVLSNKKTVQHLEGGIIKEILVKEGDTVTQGQPLMVLSDVNPRANQAILENELAVSRITHARLAALRDNAETVAFPPEIAERAQAQAELASAMREQERLFATQRETQRGKREALKQRIAQMDEEVMGLRAQVQSVSGQLGLVEEEIASVARLATKGLATKPRLLALKRQKQDLIGNRGQYTAAIAKTAQAIGEVKIEILNLESAFATDISEQLHQVESAIEGQQEKLKAASDVTQRTVIASPSEGIVTGLKFHTLGGVIPPGQPIMEIVPQGETLGIEARVNISDIDVVAPDLPATVIFSAYKARNAPRLNGRVTRVSADRFTESASGGQATYYTAMIEVPREEMAGKGKDIRLYPGMPAEVFIRTGSRSFLGYLFAPVSDSLHRAFKED